MTDDVRGIFDFLGNAAESGILPSYAVLSALIDRTADILEHEHTPYRPRDSVGRPGGLLDFTAEKRKPLIVVPDLHSRTKFLMNILRFILPDGFIDGNSGITVIEALESERIRIVFVGDVLHSELRGMFRWSEAWKEFSTGNYTGKNMTEEMTEGLSLASAVMECKCRWPSAVHVLKGNHENITNREGGGDHPFCKFADEGEMVKLFMRTYYGDDVLYVYSCVEDLLPLVAFFPQCIISHAEPRRAYTRDELINARNLPEVVDGLTWTANGEAADGSVSTMLQLLPKKTYGKTVYFGGHRPVSGTYALRQNGKFIQIHNPADQNIALVRENETFDPDSDIYAVG